MADAPEGKRPRSVLFWVILLLAVFGCAGLGAAVLFFVVAPPVIADAVERAEQHACMAEMNKAYQDLIQHKVQRNPPSGDSGAMVSWWADKPAAGPAASYAWRDMQSFPLERFPGSGREPLAACGAERHAPDVVHVLYNDGSIQPLTLAALKAEGVVPADADLVPIGPDSPVPDLRKLIR